MTQRGSRAVWRGSATDTVEPGVDTGPAWLYRILDADNNILRSPATTDVHVKLSTLPSVFQTARFTAANQDYEAQSDEDEDILVTGDLE